jgi:hypothetical protein
MTHKSAFVQTLLERGHYYQATDLEALDAAALESERRRSSLVADSYDNFRGALRTV